MMIYRKKFYGLVILSIILITSCRKSDDIPDYEYFVSQELAVTYTAAGITSLLGTGLQQYPELGGILQYVMYDVNVYKIVYTTEIKGDKIEASGLVCLPALPGEYPVLSFQNGTNTVNSQAPTNYVINPSYQLVEFLASMGFVVVIPDYPGFGKSNNIPHPYLITEPTVRSVVDMLYAVEEACEYEFTGINTLNEYYLVGYSQGGWATLALHKALELDYSDDFSLQGSVCGAGPYNLYDLLQGMTELTEYPMPYYLGYIINAYTLYDQFTNPVSDILNEPYASRLSTLYNGTLSGSQINSQLTTSLSGLLKADFLSGFTSLSSYSSVREALTRNSVPAWNTGIPVLFIHGEGDTHVNVASTNTIYDEMLQAGTSQDICKKIIIPYLDHGDAVIPAMMEGLDFILDLISQK